MIILFKCLSVLPLCFLHGMGWVLGWMVFLASSDYRQRFLTQAHQAGVGLHDCLCAVGESGKLVAELPRLWFGRPVSVLWNGIECVETALQAAHGVVFLTPHLGCFEITAQAYADRFGHLGRPITVLFRPPRQAWLYDMVCDARQRAGLMSSPTTIAGVKQLLKALKKGESVGLLPDQVPPQGMGIMAPFFGRDAYTMTLGVRLVQQTGAAVLIAWGERLRWGRGYRVHVKPLDAPLPANLADAVTSVNLVMQTLILQAPRQYLWGYGRYKLPRETL